MIDKTPELRVQLLRFAHVLQIQMCFTALANARYKLEERLARWLLMAHDRSAGATVSLTHEFLSLMLGVRRPGITIRPQRVRKARHRRDPARRRLSIKTAASWRSRPMAAMARLKPNMSACSAPEASVRFRTDVSLDDANFRSGIATPPNHRVVPMRQYEIRLLKPDLSTAHIIEVIYENDRMAVRAGRRMAEGELSKFGATWNVCISANGELGAIPNSRRARCHRAGASQHLSDRHSALALSRA